MKISTNPVLGTWEKAESDLPKQATGPVNFIPCQKNKILIVDDEVMIQQVFQRVLLKDLHDVTIDLASNGAKGVAQFRLGHHAVILMDLFMPVMDGEAAFHEIVQLCENEKWVMPAVVFCTGYNPSQKIRSTIAANPKHCMLQKPVRNQVLVETIQARLNM
jgi:CheY-like chemotaxis protein